MPPVVAPLASRPAAAGSVTHKNRYGFPRACIAVYPLDKPDQWVAGCSDGITGEREVVTVSHIGQATTKLVSTGFDTRGLESEGWRKIHDNVLVGRITLP